MKTKVMTKAEQDAIVEAEYSADGSGVDATPTETNLPAVAAQTNSVPALGEQQQMQTFFDGFGKRTAVLHNFTGTAKEIWAQTARATGPTCRTSENAIGKVIKLTRYYVHAVNCISPSDGEIQENLPRTVLVDDAGTCWGFVSRGVLDGLQLILQSFSGVIPPGGLEIVVKRVQTRGGRQLFAIDPFDPNEKPAE